MTVRLLGTVGYLARNCTSNRSGLKCCSTFCDKMHSSETQQRRQSPIIISRNFSSEAITHFPKMIFRTICESELSGYMREVYTYVHDTTGLPWWFTIVLSGVALRIYSIPFRAYQKVLLGRIHKIKNMDDIAKKVHIITVKNQKQFLWTPQKAKSAFLFEMRKQKQHLIEKYNCHPLNVIILGYIELPVWLLMSITWRTMSYGFTDNIVSSKLLTAQMELDGPFWCTNLTIPDPFYILPALVLIVQLIHVELEVIQSGLVNKEKSRFSTVLYNTSRLCAVISAIICSYLPTAVSLFWATASVFTLVRDFMFMSPKVRYVLKMPYEPVTQKEVLKLFKERMFQLFRLKGKYGNGRTVKK